MSGQWSGNYWHRADGLLLRDGGLVVYTGLRYRVSDSGGGICGSAAP